MNTIEILVTCLALSLDCFVVMMARGAMMNPQEHRRSLINSLIFAGSSLLMIVLGSLAGSLIKSQLVLHVNQVIRADPVCAGLLPADPGVSAESD